MTTDTRSAAPVPRLAPSRGHVASPSRQLPGPKLPFQLLIGAMSAHDNVLTNHCMYTLGTGNRQIDRCLGQCMCC